MEDNNDWYWKNSERGEEGMFWGPRVVAWSAMDLNGMGWDLSASLSLLHNVGWNDVWCRQRYGAGRTRPCNVLMVKAMATVVAARGALLRTKDGGKFYRIVLL